jgi:hypothetical protein
MLLGLILGLHVQFAWAQTFNCDPNGNVIIFTNYDGGELNINVDQNMS